MKVDAEKIFQYAESYLRVQNARGGPPTPFKRNAIQLDFSRNSRALRGEQVPDYSIKPRQVGLSTELLCYKQASCVVYPGRNHLWVSQDEDNARAIRRKFEIILRSCVDNPHSGLSSKDIARDNQDELVLKSGSAISFTFAGDSQERLNKIARGDTIHCAVFTEVAYWSNPQTVYESLGPGLVKSGAAISYDSTPNGVYGPGEWYYRRVQNGKAGKIPGVIHFWPWWMDPDYVRVVGKTEARRIMSTLSQRERWLMQEKGLNVHQVAWRRFMIIELCNGKEDIFLEIYPETEPEAWRRPGNSVFERELIREIVTRIEDEGAKRPKDPEEVWAAMPTELQDPRGFERDPLMVGSTNAGSEVTWRSLVRFYDLPNRDLRPYSIGVDSSEGLEDGDAQAITVVDREAQVAAILRFRMPNILVLTGLIMRVCLFYGAKVGVEKASTGPDIARLMSMVVHPIEIARHGAHPILAKVVRPTLIETNVRERPKQVSTLLQYLGGRHTTVHDPDLLREMMSFERKKDDRVEHADGEHDDMLFSLAIALRLREMSLTQSSVLDLDDELALQYGARGLADLQGADRYGYVPSGSLRAGISDGRRPAIQPRDRRRIQGDDGGDEGGSILDIVI